MCGRFSRWGCCWRSGGGGDGADRRRRRRCRGPGGERRGRSGQPVVFPLPAVSPCATLPPGGTGRLLSGRAFFLPSGVMRTRLCPPSIFSAFFSSVYPPVLLFPSPARPSLCFAWRGVFPLLLHRRPPPPPPTLAVLAGGGDDTPTRPAPLAGSPDAVDAATTGKVAQVGTAPRRRGMRRDGCSGAELHDSVGAADAATSGKVA